MAVTRQQYNQSQIIRNLDKLTKINSQLFLMRYKDSKIIIETEGKSHLKSLCEMMLLGYGFNHAAKGSGLFVDSYYRAADKSFNHPEEKFLAGIAPQRKKMLTDSVMELIDTNSNKTFISEVESKKFASEKLEIDGRKYTCVTSDTQTLGHFGVIENKDALLWAYANEEISGIPFKVKFKNLLYEMNPDITPKKFDNILDKIVRIPSIKTDADVKRDLIKLLTHHSHYPKQSFYLDLLKNLLSDLEISTFSEISHAEQYHLALTRLEFIVKNAINNIQFFEIFVNYIEFAMDEICFLLTLSQPYHRSDIQSTMRSFLQKQLNNHAPTDILLGSSGMQVIYNLFVEALREVMLRKKYSIYIQRGSYFEILLIADDLLHFDIYTTIDKTIYVESNQSVKFVKEYKDQILDVIVASFHRNFSFSEPGFRSSHLQTMIDAQLVMRSPDRTLTVLIDTTMDPFDNNNLIQILEKYKEQIASGQLAILTAHSLNKYFQMGLDKVPAGVGALYYNPKFYPRLSQIAKNHWSGGFHEDDPTMQLLTHLVKYTSTKIAEFYHLIMDSSKYIHDRIVPNSLYDYKDNLVTIDYPYTKDGAHDIWGFVLVRFDSELNVKTRKALEHNISYLLAAYGIKYRDGFGFSTTNQMRICKDPMGIRISLGMEPRQHLEAIFKPFFNYILQINEILKTNNICDCFRYKTYIAEIDKLTQQYIQIAHLTDFSKNDHSKKRPGCYLFKPVKETKFDDEQIMINEKSRAVEYKSC